VTYITGNHDEFLRPFVNQFSLGNIVVCNQAEYRDIDGRFLLLTHGDMFDGITRLGKWIGFLGDSAYDFVLWVNTKFNYIRHRLGFGYWSLSKFLKHKVKKAVGFVFNFEQNVTEYGKRKGYDGVICGHIHTPEIKMVGDMIYMNDGDWVESCSALVEHEDGRWEIIYWSKIL
jgi:UDP-2,3-diacylglucosamine pyrophosphatase LpxH